MNEESFSSGQENEETATAALLSLLSQRGTTNSNSSQSRQLSQRAFADQRDTIAVAPPTDRCSEDSHLKLPHKKRENHEQQQGRPRKRSKKSPISGQATKIEIQREISEPSRAKMERLPARATSSSVSSSSDSDCESYFRRYRVLHDESPSVSSATIRKPQRYRSSPHAYKTGNASSNDDDKNSDGTRSNQSLSNSSKAIMNSLSKRETQPAPYFGYVDHSLDEDDDPLSPLSPPLRTPSFPAKMHAILFRKDLKHVIGWMPHGRSWRIADPIEFEDTIIPLYFEHSKIASFNRQANGWGFCRMNKGRDRGSYYHEYFLRGLPFLCKQMKRLGTAKKLLTGSKEPLLAEISAERPLPEDIEADSVAAIMLNAINKCIIEGGPKAKMPVVHQTMAEDYSILNILTSRKIEPSNSSSLQSRRSKHDYHVDQNEGIGPNQKVSHNLSEKTLEDSNKLMLGQNSHCLWNSMEQTFFQRPHSNESNFTTTHSRPDQIGLDPSANHFSLPITVSGAVLKQGTAMPPQIATVVPPQNFQSGDKMNSRSNSVRGNAPQSTELDLSQLLQQAQSFPHQAFQLHQQPQHLQQQPNMLASFGAIVENLLRNQSSRETAALNPQPPSMGNNSIQLPQVLSSLNTPTNPGSLSVLMPSMSSMSSPVLQSQHTSQQQNVTSVANHLASNGNISQAVGGYASGVFEREYRNMGARPHPNNEHHTQLTHNPLIHSDEQLKELVIRAFVSGAKLGASKVMGNSQPTGFSRDNKDQKRFPPPD